MNVDRIAELLRAADRLAGAAPPVRGNLADRVRRLAHRRSRLRLRAGTLAACLVVAATALVAGRLARPNHVITPVAPPGDASGTAELMAINDEIQRLRGAIERISPHNTETGAADTYQAEFERQSERAAYLIVYQAARYAHELDMPDSAIVSYRKAIQLFPGTRAAETARTRLAELEHPNGEAS